MNRLVRATKTVPQRTWWTIALPLAFLALLAVDRHLAATAFAAWAGYRVLKHQRGRRASQAAKARNEEIPWLNPSTGLPMLFNDLGGVDTAGYYFNEDTLHHHRGDEG
jgi:hypothetical protein